LATDKYLKVLYSLILDFSLMLMQQFSYYLLSPFPNQLTVVLNVSTNTD